MITLIEWQTSLPDNVIVLGTVTSYIPCTWIMYSKMLCQTNAVLGKSNLNITDTDPMILYHVISKR